MKLKGGEGGGGVSAKIIDTDNSCKTLLYEQLCFGPHGLVLQFGQSELVPHVSCLQFELQLCTCRQEAKGVHAGW